MHAQVTRNSKDSHWHRSSEHFELGAHRRAAVAIELWIVAFQALRQHRESTACCAVLPRFKRAFPLNSRSSRSSKKCFCGLLENSERHVEIGIGDISFPGNVSGATPITVKSLPFRRTVLPTSPRSLANSFLIFVVAKSLLQARSVFQVPPRRVSHPSQSSERTPHRLISDGDILLSLIERLLRRRAADISELLT